MSIVPLPGYRLPVIARLGTLLFLLLTACNGDYTRKQPRLSDVLGKWLPTQASLKQMKERGGYAISHHEIELRADGSCSAIGMPDWLDSPIGESHQRLASAVGRWILSRDDYDDSRYVVKLSLDRAQGLTLSLRRQARPYLLTFSIGDPDSSNLFVLERAIE